MKTRGQILQECNEVYFAIKQIMKESELDYCQSWWLNTRSFKLKSNLSTPEINRRAKLLVKQGYLIIDKSKTKTSTGISYKLTDKIYPF